MPTSRGEDVEARSLANAYAQMLGQIFTNEMKPMEVDILVAEVGHHPLETQLFHVQYDGTLLDESHFTVLGGDAEAIRERLGEHWTENASLEDAISVCASALAGPDRSISASELEVAVLDRTRERRLFKRISSETVTRAISESAQ